MEAGPFTWFLDEDESLTPEDKLDALQRHLNQVSVGTGTWALWVVAPRMVCYYVRTSLCTPSPSPPQKKGLMQQHLTRKIVNTDVGYLSAWSSEALDLVGLGSAPVVCPYKGRVIGDGRRSKPRESE